MKKVLFAVLASVMAVGCYAESGYGYQTTTVGVAGPNMVYVDGAPGVQVIADYDYPVFYSDNMYWRYDGGVWYSSRWHDRGWGVNYNVPVGVRGIRSPENYAHYNRGAAYRGGYANERGPATRGPAYRGAPAGPVVRDHRAGAPAPAPARRAPAPVVRDHRR